MYSLIWLAVLALAGCDIATNTVDARTFEAAPIEDQEDAVCGMLVREQTAPRGQVVHRDGTYLFFCSLGDMLVYLGAPSPHGSPEAVYVEVMDPKEDPLQSHTGAHPWVPADSAVYVVGIERERIMGKPVLAYATHQDAEQAMMGHDNALLLQLPGLRTWWE